MAGPDESLDAPAGQGANSLTPEQRDTARLLRQLMGKTVADRYVDFCRLSAGDFALKVASPMAAHSLRELDSILRSTLAVPFEAKTEAALSEKQKQDTIKALKALGHEQAAIDRALRELAPKESHREQIRRIVTRLGLDPDGDIAKAWFQIMRAAHKAHERPFNRTLRIDDAFREDWAKPFETVVRGVAVALQGHYSALAKRVEFLASMEDTEKAIELFENEIPGAMPLQWLFFKRLEGPRWLPILVKKGLIAPPEATDDDDEGATIRYREWPVGAYLLNIAKTGDATDRNLVAEALRSVRKSQHPDLRRDGLEIMAALPGPEAAALADVADEWLESENSLFFGGHHAEALLKRVADAGERDAALRIGSAMLRIFEKDGHLRSHYASQLYEHSLPKTARTLVKIGGLDALKLLVDLLYRAAKLDGRIRHEPPFDQTSVILAPLSSSETAHDIFGGLVQAVSTTATALVQQPNAPVAEIIAILSAHEERIFRRIAYRVLAHSPDTVPDLSDDMLLDGNAIDSYSLRYEYGELAKARFPKMAPEKQAALFGIVDAIPAKHEPGYRRRFEEHEKRAPEEKDLRTYRMAMVRDALWEWRDVLPPDRRKTLDEIVAEIRDPDAWKRDLGREDKSPMSAEDFKLRTPEEVAEYLRAWQPDPKNSETKTALAFELYRAVQADAEKFAAGAMAFADLPAIYARRFFEGLRNPAQNKAKFSWAAPLRLIEAVLPRVTIPAPGEISSGGDDPSWFWAALEAGQLLRSGLQQGKDGIDFENAALVARLVVGFEKLAPSAPEGDTFEKLYAENPYFAAENTMLGLATDLCVAEIFWLSKHEGSFAAKSPREALRNSPTFSEFAKRALLMNAANGRIVRAILGRYLSWLYYFDAEWLQAHMDQIIPSADKELRDAAWVGHLMNGGGPVLPLLPYMHQVYTEETERLLVPRKEHEREWRQDNFGDHVLVQYLYGDYPKDLLDRFFANAPARLLQHTIWTLGRQLGHNKTLADVTKRGLEYWEMRLAAAEKAADKGPFKTELGSISSWLHDTDLNPTWLVEQMLRMLRAGYTPSQPYSVVEYASRIVDKEPALAVELIAELFRHPETDQWAYTTQQSGVRKILEDGLATGDVAVRENVERVISYLVSRGETSFLDLSENPRT